MNIEVHKDIIFLLQTSTQKDQTSKFVEDVVDWKTKDFYDILMKENYGASGILEFCKNMLLATQSLEDKFRVTG